MEHARQALRAWVERLNPDDTFNILRFSTDVEPLAEQSLNASPENRPARCASSTAWTPPAARPSSPRSRQALAVPARRGAPAGGGVPHRRDAHRGRDRRDAIMRRSPSSNHSTAQVFVFGLGDDVNTTFLDLLAQQNRGAADYARSGAEMSTLLAGFYNKHRLPRARRPAPRAARRRRLRPLPPRPRHPLPRRSARGDGPLPHRPATCTWPSRPPWRGRARRGASTGP
jgi:Ca-activated chloride channel family protein